MGKQFYILLYVIVFSWLNASANSYTWIGGGPDGFWTTFQNWSPQGVPGPGDIVNISNNGPTLASNTEVGTVNMSDQGGIYRPSGTTYSLAINDGLGYTGGGFAVDLILGIDCGSNFSHPSSLGFSGISVTNYGEIYCNTNFNLNYSILTNYGTFICAGPYTMSVINNPGIVDNYGVFKTPAISSATFIAGIFLNNKPSGDIIVENGTLDIPVGFQNEGDIIVFGGAFFKTNGATLQAGTTLSGEGTWQVVGNPTTINADVAVDVATTEYEAQPFGGPGELTFSKTLLWKEGSMQVPQVTIAPTGHVITEGAGGKSMYNLFTNNGTFDMNANFSVLGTLENNGVLYLNENGEIGEFGAITNTGSIIKMAVTSNFTISPSINNSGLIQCQSAQTVLERGLTNTGTVEVFSDASLLLNNIYDNNLNSGSNIIGDGTLIAFGYLDVNADVNLAIEYFQVYGYGLRGTHRLGILNNMTWTEGTIDCIIHVGSSGFLDIQPGFKSLTTGGLENEGSVHCSADIGLGTIYQDPAYIVNDGTFELADDNYFYQTSESSFFENNGLLDKTSFGLIDFGLFLNNQTNGTIRVASGELQVLRLINHGILNIFDGALLTVQDGTYSTGSSLLGTGIFKVANMGFMLEIDLNLTTNSLYIDGNLYGVGNLIIGTTADWEDGQIGVATTVNTGAVLNFLPFGSKSLVANLANEGTVNCRNHFGVNGNITNNGIFNLVGGGVMNQAGMGQFTNNNLLQNNGNFSNFSFGLPVSNPSGSNIVVGPGRVNFEGGLANSGAIEVQTQGHIQLCGNSSLSPSSNLNLNGAVVVCGDLDFGPNLVFLGEEFILTYGAVLEGPGSLIVQQLMTWEGGDIEIPVGIEATAILNIGQQGGGGDAFWAKEPAKMMFDIGVLRETITAAGATNIYQDFEMDGGAFINNGETTPYGVVIGSSSTGSFTSNGLLHLEGGIRFDGVIFNNNGTINGNGDLSANPAPVNNGIFSPGNSPGQISFMGDFFPGAELIIEVENDNGPGSGHDFVQVNNNAPLSGKLTVLDASSAPDGTYIILHCDGGPNCISGSFSPIELPPFYSLSMTGTDISLVKMSVFPVELVDFEATLQGDMHAVRLTWSTKSEKNNLGFAVERKLALEGDWNEIGRVAGNGNSAVEHEYLFYDEEIKDLHGDVYYRLRQMDYDGSFGFSPVRSVKLTDNGIIVQVFPNPFDDKCSVLLANSAEPSEILLLDAVGRLVFSQKTGEANGQLLSFDASDLPSGIYWLEVRQGMDTMREKIMKN